MNMVLGIITAVIFLLTSAKFITKRLPSAKPHARFIKIHKILGIALLVIAIIHAVKAWELIRQRPMGMYIIGIILIIGILITILSHIFAKKLGGKWLKVHRSASVMIGVCLIIHIILSATSFYDYQKAIASISYDDINVSKIADGNHNGEFDAGYIYARVIVTVGDGKITSIDLLEHRNERGAPAEQITVDVISKQSLNVDAVSGATNSSKVIKKAIENALAQGIS